MPVHRPRAFRRNSESVFGTKRGKGLRQQVEPHFLPHSPRTLTPVVWSGRCCENPVPSRRPTADSLSGVGAGHSGACRHSTCPRFSVSSPVLRVQEVSFRSNTFSSRYNVFRQATVDLAMIEEEETHDAPSRTRCWSTGFDTPQRQWSIFAVCQRGKGERSWTRWTTSFDTSPTCPLGVESECGRILWRPGSFELGTTEFSMMSDPGLRRRRSPKSWFWPSASRQGTGSGSAERNKSYENDRSYPGDELARTICP